MKKIKKVNKIAIAIVLIPLLFIGYNKFKKQNIYDEMYHEAAGVTNELFSFQSRSAFGDIPNMEPKVRYYSSLSENGEVITEENYQEDKLPRNMTNLSIMFYKKKKEMIIYIRYSITPDVEVGLENIYEVKEKELKQNIYIFDSAKPDRRLITDNDKISEYLKKYNISKEQLEEWYDQGMNQILIKDWRKVYPSRYSDKKLGNLKIINEWE